MAGPPYQVIRILEARAPGSPGVDHAPESGSVVVRNWLKQSRHCWTVDLQRANVTAECCRVPVVEV